MSKRLTDHDVESLAEQLRAKQYDSLIRFSIEENGARRLAGVLREDHELYSPLILATASLPKRWYDWNLGFLIPHLHLETVISVVTTNKESLPQSEGLAWGFGEIGSDDERIVDFLYWVCEQCRDYDAWWCAADALEKLGQCDATDLKKRTLRGSEWNNLDNCLANLNKRPAVIGVLRLAVVTNTRDKIIPRCREVLRSQDRKAIQNAVWLLERFRVDDGETLEALSKLYSEAEDVSHTLKPRVVEALGQIASPVTRLSLENALKGAQYYRTRAYAAIGLGRIGDPRSVSMLAEALANEEDHRVVGHISTALYNIQSKVKRTLNQVSLDQRWPENGMIVDQTNDWYANPQIYDHFSNAEDPLGVSLRFALSYIQVPDAVIADLGTGTGRFALFAAEDRRDIHKVFALDANPEMHKYLVQQLGFAGRPFQRIEPVLGDLSKLPFDDASLDAAISSWGFPSNMWDTQTCLQQVREVHRVLKDHGLLVTVGWDENFRDQLSELWFRFVPEPDFRRESIETWRKRRRSRIRSPRNCHLTFVKTNLRVPLLFDTPTDAAMVLGHLFGFSAGEWVAQQQRCEFSIHVGVTVDSKSDLKLAIERLERNY
jgi:ubiquinone/menaquinone biosynthesis C-methylase UbiE